MNDHQFEEKKFRIFLGILFFIGVVSILLYFLMAISPKPTERSIGYPVHSILIPNYQPDGQTNQFSKVDLSIIKDVLLDTFRDLSQEEVLSFFNNITNQLLTPVPTSTPIVGGSDEIDSDQTGKPTQSRSSTISPSLTMENTLTSHTAASPTRAVPTVTMRPTTTKTPILPIVSVTPNLILTTMPTRRTPGIVTYTPTTTPTKTPTLTRTASPTIHPTQTMTKTATATSTVTRTATPTTHPTQTMTNTATATSTVTRTATPTTHPAQTMTNTASPTQTLTRTAMPTITTVPTTQSDAVLQISIDEIDIDCSSTGFDVVITNLGTQSQASNVIVTVTITNGSQFVSTGFPVQLNYGAIQKGNSKTRSVQATFNNDWKSQPAGTEVKFIITISNEESLPGVNVGKFITYTISNPGNCNP